MKIVYVPDILDWAIGTLAKAKVKHTPYHNNLILPVHPRDAIEKADWFLSQVKEFNPDVIVYEYFRSAAQLIQTKPELKNYKSILVHHNQRDKALFHADWKELGIDTIVTHTSKCREKLMGRGYINVETINHGIDLDRFPYNEKEPEIPAIGYVGRVVSWKGLREIAEVAEELNYPIQMMGRIDDGNYWSSVPKNNLRFDFFDCPPEEVPSAYNSMTIYVGNSEDDYEEGTLPFLEAMASGVPVVTTPNGVAKDIAKDGYNALVVPFKDKVALKDAIQRLMSDKELRSKLRKNAWNTVKNMTEAKMAYEYSNLFYRVRYKEPLVSVIIPSTKERAKQVEDILIALDNSDYEAIEAIVVWDEIGSVEPILTNTKLQRLTVKYLQTGKEGYNLAKARNMGAIEAEGTYLMFCDSRLLPNIEAVKAFVYAGENVILDKKQWFFGNKGSEKKAFVENFSFVKRSDFIEFGMMPEYIDRYGGMSQEIRTRWTKQGGEFQYIGEARAEEMLTSGMTPQKRKDIVDMKLRLYKMYLGENH